jgi:hypothetical protein
MHTGAHPAAVTGFAVSRVQEDNMTPEYVIVGGKRIVLR